MHQNLGNLVLLDNVVHQEFHPQGLWLSCFNTGRVYKTPKHQASEEKGFFLGGGVFCFVLLLLFSE